MPHPETRSGSASFRRSFITLILVWVAGLALPVSAATMSFQDPTGTTPGYDATWVDGFGSGNAVYGVNNQIRLGRNSSSVNGVARGLVRWDISKLFGVYSNITGITVEFTTAGYSASTTGGTIELWSVGAGDSGWSAAQSTKNQKNKAYGFNWAAGSADALGFKLQTNGVLLGTASYAANQASGQKITINLTGTSAELTALVDDWIEGRRSGLLVKAADESITSSDLYLHANGNATLGNRPKLTIIYNAGYKVMADAVAVNFLSQFRSYFGATWDTSVTPNRVREGGGGYTMDRNARYAHCLLDTGVATNFPAAEGIIAYIRTNQFLVPGDNSQHGHIKYQQSTTSVAGSNPALHDFCTLSLLSIRSLHYGKLSATAQTNLNAILTNAIVWTRWNRNYGVLGINNQGSAAYANMLIGGQIYNNADVLGYGQFMWGLQWNNWLWTNVVSTTNGLNIHEFNSPTYGFVNLENLSLMMRYLNEGTQVQQARTYYRWAWEEMARHYHVPSRQTVGPWSRTYAEINPNYSPDGGGQNLASMRDGAFGVAFTNTVGPHISRVPGEFMPFYLDPLTVPRMDTDVFVAGPTNPQPTDVCDHGVHCAGVVPIIGRTYLHPNYVMGSLNFGKMGYYAAGTKRPLMAHWGTGSDTSAYAFSVQTLVNDGSGLKETSRPLLFTSHEDGTPNVLAGITWSHNPNNDYPISTSTSFTASDLRIRFSIRAAQNSAPNISVPANLTDPVAITAGGVTTTVKLVYADFPGFTPVWTVTLGSPDPRLRYLDMVIYSGGSTTIDLTTKARFSAAFALTVGTNGAAAPVVSSSINTSHATLSWGTNQLTYPTQPDSIHVLARNYRSLLQLQPMGAPVGLAAVNGSSGQVNLSWADQASSETGFEIQRRIGLGGSWVSNGVAAVNAAAYTDASVPALTELWYRVRAFNASTQGVWSTEAAVITSGSFATPASLAQTMPSNATAQASVVLTNVASAAQNFSVSVPGGSGVYTWADTSGSFAWQEMSGTGSLVSIWAPNSDDGLAQVSGSLDIPLGLTFPFYGQSYTSVRIHANGYLAFNNDTSTIPGNALLPQAGSIPRPIIAALWDDLVVDASSSVYFQKTAADTFIVQYQNILRYSTSERSTFQVVLKSDGTIIMRYKDNTNGGYYTIGLNNQDGTKGPQVAYNTAYLPTTGNNINRAITFTPPSTWLSLVTAQPVAVAAGGSASVTFHFNSASLTNGVYSNTVSVTSDLARQPSFTIPVQLTVTNGTPPPPVTNMVYALQNGVGGYSGNQGRATSTFGGGTTTSDDYIAAQNGSGNFITPIRFNALPKPPYASVNALTLALKVKSNTLNTNSTLGLVFNNRGANSAWTEAGVNYNTLNGTTAWSGPSGKLANNPYVPLTGAWDVGSGAANNGLPLLAAAPAGASTTVGTTITFAFTNLTAAERLDLMEIWANTYPYARDGQTYADNPGLFLLFSENTPALTGDIRFHGDNDATVANRPVLTVDVSPGSILTLVSSQPTNTYGQPVTLTATVTGGGLLAAPTPAGNITFKRGTTVLGSAPLAGGNATASAALTLTNLPAGSNSLSAEFAADGNYPATVSAALLQIVLPASLTPVVTVSNKIYDATTTASIATRGFVPGGVVGGDNVTLIGGTAVFVSPNVGNAITVNVTGLALGGLSATNYVLSSTTASTTADIIAPTPPTLANVQLLPGGQFGYSFTSTAGQLYTVWTSTNLAGWVSLTNFLGDGGNVAITDAATNWPAKYYRLSSP